MSHIKPPVGDRVLRIHNTLRINNFLWKFTQKNQSSYFHLKTMEIFLLQM